jgi:alpha/beta superfamily hydrolase
MKGRSRSCHGGGVSFSLDSARLFAIGVALIAVHVIDDNFVQPQPGTAASDHLVSGLVPLAILVLAALAYPRARAGTRAILALAMVLPAILSGAEAIHYAADPGLSGDDYTGLVAMTAAPPLLVLGVRGLWRSRRRGDHPVRRYVRRSLKSVTAVAVLAVFAVPTALAYVGSHAARATVPRAELGTAHETVHFETSDGLRLEGWYVPSRNGAAVIVFPGRTGTMKHARMLARHGYGVLLFDRRGEGHSQGDPDGWGWDFDKDIRGALGFLERRADVDHARIGGLGLSVGGEMMLQTAAHTTDLAAVVAEGAGARTMAEEVDDVSGPNKVLTALSYGARDLTNAILHDRLPPDNLIDLLPKIAPRPVFLIHAGANDVGRRAPDYYEAVGSPKQIWQARGGHTDGIDRQPREYERRVAGFFDRALLR